MRLVVDARTRRARGRGAARARARAARRARGPCPRGRPRTGRGPPPSPRTWRRRRGGSDPRSGRPARVDDDADARVERRARARRRRPDRTVVRAAGRRARSRPAPSCSSSRSANSSPPSRASVSPARDHRRRIASRPPRSSRSPASCPSVSLTCLNPSRSTSSTPSGVARALRAGERLVEPVAEQRAVGEAGQPVVEGLRRQLLLEPDALGDVARVEDDAADAAVVAEVGDVRLEVAPSRRSGCVTRNTISLGGSPFGVRCLAARSVVGVDELERSRRRAARSPRARAST